MIGSLIAKKKTRSGFAQLSRGDFQSFVSNWSNDAIFSYPPDISVGGVIEGKKAIIEWFQRWIEQFPKRDFTLRNICVRDICSFTASNCVAVEWTVHFTNKDGQDFDIDGVTTIDARNFKAVRVCDYISDIPTLKKAWGEG